MNFPSIRLEGSILTADLLDAIAREDKHSQKPTDFGLATSTKVKDEIASTWASAKALWTGYQAKIANLHEGQFGASETRNLFMIPLLALLGYQPERTETEVVNGKSYAISHRDISRDGFPLHIMGWHDSLEKKRETGGPRVSAHALVQEYLNLTEHAYGIITNGRQLRLLRDSSRLIKLSFLEFDLNRIFEEDLYADFAILFRLLHATRMPANRAHASASVIEKYHQDSVDSGSRIRDGLAAAVAFSMQTVANGLLAHPDNASLVDKLRKEPARANELHQNLLRWVYRTLFVLVIEERVLHHAPGATLRQRRLYRDYYSLQRLRRLADRPQLADRRSHDLWRAMHQTLRLYEDGGKGLPLGVAPLGSFLFREEGLQQLFQYQLDNRSILQALNRLSTFTHPDTNVRMRVNYGALDVEEFGSVYESLLELRPRITPEGEKLTFSYVQLAGNERKTTGSYYTPDSLVQCLLDSALDPVVEGRLKGKTGPTAEEALLSIKVCDPAVGSGHFLIGAAHRLAQRLADIRAGEEALSPDVQRHALRDVVSRCLYGVDINPLSVELCKVSLWMLAMEPGKPLGFLDHHIRCGNSLLGTTPELVAEGLPDDAFNAIEGDDKQACAELKKRNKGERKGLGVLFAKEDAANREKLQKAVSAIDAIGDDSPEAICRKETAFKNTQQNYDFQKARDLADLWCAAFVIKKHFSSPSPAADTLSASNGERDGVRCRTESSSLEVQTGLFGDTEEAPKAKAKKTKAPSLASLDIPIGITTQHLRDFVEGGALPDGLFSEAKRLADQYQFFHYHLAFPEVSAQGGFDVFLGNPPWEASDLMKVEFFASLLPSVASARTTEDRLAVMKKAIAEDQQLEVLWDSAMRENEARSQFTRASGRYPLTSGGKLNTYRTFAELSALLLNQRGRMGLILKSGIINAQDNQEFFASLLRESRVVAAHDFINTKELFPDVVANERFCLLTVTGVAGGVKEASFMFCLDAVDQLADAHRRIVFTSGELLALNPNDMSVPPLTSAADKELLVLAHRRVPVLIDSPQVKNRLHVRYARGHLNSSTDSGLFAKNYFEALAASGWVDASGRWNSDVVRPLIEGKLIGMLNHRFGTFLGVPWATRFGKKAEAKDPSPEELRDANFRSVPRFWLRRSDAQRLLAAKNCSKRWLFTFRHVCRAVVDARTAQVCISPNEPTSDSCALLLFDDEPFQSATNACLLVAGWTSFVGDYVLRQKIYGPALTKAIAYQLPAPCTEILAGHRLGWIDVEFVRSRVLELTYTAWDLEAFAQDCGWSGPPFRWDEDRRFLLRCELDAAFFHLYLGTEAEWSKQPEALTKAFPTPRHAVDYIMDTFPIVKRKDEARTAEKNAAGEVVKPGRYFTKDTILGIYDALAESQRTGRPYQTRLNPPPGPPVGSDGCFVSYESVTGNPPPHLHLPRGASRSLTAERQLADLGSEFPSIPFILRLGTRPDSTRVRITPSCSTSLKSGTPWYLPTLG